jgi:hypothetical protein
MRDWGLGFMNQGFDNIDFFYARAAKGDSSIFADHASIVPAKIGKVPGFRLCIAVFADFSKWP